MASNLTEEERTAAQCLQNISSENEKPPGSTRRSSITERMAKNDGLIVVLITISIVTLFLVLLRK